MARQLLFSLGPKDFEIQYFRSGGAGGQHQNRRETGVRIIHPESGARGESREERSQLQNKKTAFLRMANSYAFKRWHNLRCWELLSKGSLEERAEKQMEPHNLRVEVKDDKGRWVPETPEV
jgi:peptide chain release factor 1